MSRVSWCLNRRHYFVRCLTQNYSMAILGCAWGWGTSMKLMCCRICVAIGALMCLYFSLSSASGQVQPLIVDLAATAFRGLVWGAAGEAGKEIVEGMRSRPPSEPPTAQYPNGNRTFPGPERSAPIIPVDPPPPADGIHWRMRNEFGANIVMQFYSPSRHVHWPAGYQAYLLVPGQVTVIRLRCVPGEKICYGGNVPGRYWGTGLSAGFPLRHPCVNCCRICGTDSRIALR